MTKNISETVVEANTSKSDQIRYVKSRSGVAQTSQNKQEKVPAAPPLGGCGWAGPDAEVDAGGGGVGDGGVVALPIVNGRREGGGGRGPPRPGEWSMGRPLKTELGLKR